MEDYRRSAKSGGDTENEKDLPPPADNEIRITQGKKMTGFVDIGLDMLKRQQKSSIIIVGKGATINKAVSVVEIIKRRMAGCLHQYTQLGSVTAVEQWDPVKGVNQDRILVNKRIPVISIHLSTDVIPDLAKISGYQEPTGPDIYT